MPPNTQSVLSLPEQEKARKLTRMKWLATGLFVLMAVIFALTFVPEQPYSWLPYVRAFSEAAMVGALADWFAVTALFRHPFGIPIPHTAIVPNNKDKIGESLAGFVERNFLTSEVLAPKLAEINIAQRIGLWMADEEHAKSLSGDVAALVDWVLESVDNDALRTFLDKNLRSDSSTILVAPMVAKVIGALTSSNRHQQLVDSFVQIARQQLIENQNTIRDRINSQSPWWLPKFVDEEIYQKIIGEIAQLLDRIGDDPHHPARHRFNQATAELIDSMSTDPQTIAKGETLKQEILNHPAVRRYITQSWDGIKQYISNQTKDTESNLHSKIVRAVQRMGTALQKDEAMQQQVNGWFQDGVMRLLHNHQQSIGQIISDTVKSWDTDVTTRRVELQVGRDLQFIRINGTLVGGLVGLVIYSIVKAF